MTLVYFRFGWDLADRIRSHGFACDHARHAGAA
jgi:hypothetical protein